MYPEQDIKALNRKKAKRLFILGGVLMLVPFISILLAYVIAFIFNLFSNHEYGPTTEIFLESIFFIPNILQYLGWLVLLPLGVVLWVIALVITIRR